jgi:hypothetical protein
LLCLQCGFNWLRKKSLSLLCGISVGLYPYDKMLLRKKSLSLLCGISVGLQPYDKSLQNVKGFSPGSSISWPWMNFSAACLAAEARFYSEALFPQPLQPRRALAPPLRYDVQCNLVRLHHRMRPRIDPRHPHRIPAGQAQINQPPQVRRLHRRHSRLHIINRSALRLLT